MKDAEIIFQPELLTRIEEKEIAKYVDDPRYWFEQKRDGDRRTIAFEAGVVIGFNKLGQIVPVSTEIEQALRKMNRWCVLDGELESDGLWAWDLLALDGKDVSGAAYGVRKIMLEQLLLSDDSMLSIDPLLLVVKSVRDGKREFLDRMKAEGVEGIVVKDSQAPYRGGRVGSHFKYKFEETASFIVGPKIGKRTYDGKRTVAIYLYDSGIKRCVATVKIAEKWEVPEDGQIIEVRYLYAYPGADGKIVQPVFFGVVRKDVRPEECDVSQLKYIQQ